LNNFKFILNAFKFILNDFKFILNVFMFILKLTGFIPQAGAVFKAGAALRADGFAGRVRDARAYGKTLVTEGFRGVSNTGGLRREGPAG
jgi:hypothetical protein